MAVTASSLGERSAASGVAALFLAATAMAGCSPSTDNGAAPETTSSVVDPLPETAFSTERIVVALLAGEIDEPTSLLYRLWAQFGDRPLPEQFRGASEPHDLCLFSDIGEDLESMPAEIRTQIEPFLQRPSNPDSAFSGGDSTTESVASGETQTLEIQNVADAVEPTADKRCSQD